ncbi:hypothetical protein [Bradyrhizobium sp.]|jgi:hypothetical protein|uniref:hypothetical protein n=1 Tax=Bradyrhizobium sp. TaxID=376 RepID=UPI003D0EEF62
MPAVGTSNKPHMAAQIRFMILKTPSPAATQASSTGAQYCWISMLFCDGMTSTAIFPGIFLSGPGIAIQSRVIDLKTRRPCKKQFVELVPGHKTDTYFADVLTAILYGPSTFYPQRCACPPILNSPDFS